MAMSCCCKSISKLILEPKHVEWMKNLPNELHNEPITKIAIPGTHNSFAFDLSSQAGPDLAANLKRFHTFLSPIIKNWSRTQNLNFTEQLHIGIRYFDLRVCHTKDRFYFTHGLLAGLVRDGLEEINEYLNKYPKEIVLLDFNHFYDFNDGHHHEQLIEIIYRIFGNKICTTTETIVECTLNYLWTNNQQVILLYGHKRDQCSGYTNRIGHFFQICQSPWPNTARIDHLFEFLDEKVSSSRSITCINVLQGQITPNNETIQTNLLSSLEKLARETNQRLIQWISLRQRDPSVINGINVIICDFANLQFTDTVIMLNHKTFLSV